MRPRGEEVERNKHRMVIESLGVYLPPNSVSTSEVVEGCDRPLDFPLESLSGIRSRRMAGEDEYSIDLARTGPESLCEIIKIILDQLNVVLVQDEIQSVKWRHQLGTPHK